MFDLPKIIFYFLFRFLDILNVDLNLLSLIKSTEIVGGWLVFGLGNLNNFSGNSLCRTKVTETFDV